MDIPLHASLDRHLDALISGPESDIEAIFEQCLHESSSSCSGAGHLELFLSAIRDLRSKHPQGMSKRRSRRRAVVNSLVEELHQIRKGQERNWWKTIATLPIAAVVKKLKNIPPEHLDAALERLLQLPVSDPYIHNEQIHDSQFAQILSGFQNYGRVSAAEEVHHGRDDEDDQCTRR